MACHRIAPNIIVCGPDGEGSAIVNGREWRWEFHEYLGPTFLRKDGEPMERFPGPRHAVWKAFAEWLPQYRARKQYQRELRNAAASTGDSNAQT